MPLKPDAADASRRSFLKWSALLGGATALGGGGLLLSQYRPSEPGSGVAAAASHVFHTANTPECLRRPTTIAARRV